MCSQRPGHRRSIQPVGVAEIKRKLSQILALPHLHVPGLAIAELDAQHQQQFTVADIAPAFRG